MAVVKKKFAITSSTGSIMFSEGQQVSMEIAKAYPEFMEGYVSNKKEVTHDPTLPAKLTKAAAEKMKTERLEAWVLQYHPKSAPESKMERADLIDLVVALQE